MAKIDSQKITITRADINIDIKNILKALLIPPGHEDEYTMGLINEYMTECLSICSPLAAYSVVDHPEFISNTEMTIEGNIFHLDKIVLSALKKASHIALFIGTAGDDIENLSKKLMSEGHALEGLICNLIGSEIAEFIAEMTHNTIGKDMQAKGLNITNRYSPGYCHWPVSDQHQLFSILNGNSCGVALNKSSLMTPIKSVSGIVGIGSEVKYRGYTCSKCTTEHCIYRDKK